MKAKKFLAGALAAITALACCLFTGCGISLAIVAPKAYADWDGNYIYRGNVRSKTTGEDDEYLIQEVTHEGVEYTVSAATDCAYVGDDIYLCLRLRGPEDSESISDTQSIALSCLARYNVKNKSTEFIYFDYDNRNLVISKITESYVVLYFSASKDSSYFCVDYEGNVLNKTVVKDEQYWRCLGEYFIIRNGRKFFYETWGGEEPVLMFTLDREVDFFNVEYIAREGRKGFLFAIGFNDAYEFICFYDLVNEYQYTFDNMDVNMTSRDSFAMDGDYLVFGTYIPNPIDYSASSRLRTDCKLYKIDWSVINNGEFFKQVYNFSKEYQELDFSLLKILNNEYIYFCGREYSKPKANGEYHIITYNYRLNTKNGELTNIDKSLKKSGSSNMISDLSESSVKASFFNNYIYFIDYRTYRSGIGRAYLQILGCYDIESGKVKIMQAWAKEYTMEEYGENIEFRYSSKMWGSASAAMNAIVRNY